MLIFCTEPARYSNAVTGLSFDFSLSSAVIYEQTIRQKRGEEEYIYETKTNKKKKKKGKIHLK
jgi:hypothetical protein